MKTPKPKTTNKLFLFIFLFILCSAPTLAVSVNGGTCKDTPYKMGTEENDQFALTCIGPSSEPMTGCIAEFRDEEGRLLGSFNLNPGEDVNAPKNASSWSLYNCFSGSSEESNLNLTWQLALIIIGVLGFLFGVIWLTFKYGEKDEENKHMPNPVLSAVMFGLFTVVFFLVLEALDVIPPGWSKDHWYFFIAIFVGALLWAFYRRAGFKLMAPEKLEDIVWKHIYRRLRAKPHVGDAFGAPLPYSKLVTTNKKNEEKGAFNKRMVYIARINRNGGMFVLVSLDPTDGYLIEFVERVDHTTVRKMLGKEASEHYDLEKAMLEEQFSPQNNQQTEDRNYGSQPSPS